MVESEELIVDILDERVVEKGEEVGNEILNITNLTDRDLAAVLSQSSANDVLCGQRRD